MVKRGESFAVVALSLLFVFIFISACSSNNKINSEINTEVKQSAPQTEAKVQLIDTNADLKKFAIDAKDLPGFRVVSETAIERNLQNPSAPTRYLISFDNKLGNNFNSTQYKSIFNEIFLYHNVSSLNKGFSKEIMLKSMPSTYNESTAYTLGDESYIFSGKLFGTDMGSIWFRKHNVLVKLSFVGIGAKDAASYASIIESRINNG